MTIVLRGGSENINNGQPLINSLTQRSHRSSGLSSSRFNGNRYRRTENSTIAGTGTSSSMGGHPFLAGSDPQKKEIKHRFEITAKLGSGTYGKVSLAFDHKTEREVAVKLIKKSAIENKQDLVRIRREIRIMSMLNHPNLIQIYEVFENKDKIILVMEYANGGELYDYVSKNGSLSEQEARRIFRQITSAVLYCHKNKVAHRDLKLENILLDSNNNAKIADFGLSNYFGQKNKLLSTFCGSPLYASPEIINGTPYKGPEVDCWSLGILLYTLVYGSMPFDGRDFNRMVRQIKRGAYYEPDTPSTASMLIRNMLRVNPDRRATIYDISGHWWLNLEENMPVIQELPENQITDPTPLTERAEIMIVQELADETDVFMEFGHLSQTTRKKIEEFRRRRKEAEEYNENSPIKPPKNKKEKNENEEELLSESEKSLRKLPEKEIIKEENQNKLNNNNNNNTFYDPLERLKKLESRLGGGKKINENNLEINNNNIKKNNEDFKQKNILLNDKKDEKDEKEEILNKRKLSNKSITKINEQKLKTKDLTKKKNEDPTQYWHLETDSLNALMNQVLEQMEKGPVSLNLIAHIRAHHFYNERPEVKELLETIINAQSVEIQRKASKITKQKSKDIENILKQNSSKEINKKENNIIKEEIKLKTITEKRKAFRRERGPAEERRWHSVEVGFSTDSSTEDTQQQQNEEYFSSTTKKEIIPPISSPQIMSAPKFVGTRISRSEPYRGFEDEEYLEDEDEFYDVAEEEGNEFEGEIDELAEEVEQVIGEEIEEIKLLKQKNNLIIKNNNNENTKKVIKEKDKSSVPTTLIEKSVPSEDGPSTSKTTDSLERGLAKRVSKGKYQYNTIDGSVQLPNQKDKKEQFNKKKAWMKSHDPDAESLSAEDSSSSAIAPKAEPEEVEEEEENNNNNDEEEEEEEEEEEDTPFRPKPSTIIGFRTIHPTGTDGIPKEAPIVQVKPQSSQPQSPINKNQTQIAQQINNQVKSPKSPSPTLKESPEPSLRYESAAAYIRRKNRERRARNATVAVTEDTWTRFPSQEQPSDEPSSPRHKNSNASGKLSNGSGYGRNEENNSIYSRQTYLDRRKSFHEMSPPNDEIPYDRYAIAGGYFNSLVGNNYMPSNISRYEEEVYNAFNNKQYGGGVSSRVNAWPLQQQQQQHNYYGNNKERPERFEVYKTMAERASEFGRNDLSQYQHRMSAGGSCYYPGERPLSSYAGGTIGLRSGRIPLEDLQQYGRRSIYETERPITPCNEYIPGNYYSHNQSIIEPESPPRGGEGRFRRKISALRDVDGRRAHASRSQSNDHMAMLSRGTYIPPPDELEQIEPITGNSRYATPEIGNYSSQIPEYSYISYNDSSNGGQQQYINTNNNNRPSRRDQNNNIDLDATPVVRGILKNRQAYEVEPRAQGRLRRHQSVDKNYNINSHSLDEHYHHYNNNNQDLYNNNIKNSSYSRRYGGSSDHLPGIIGASILPSYQQQQSIYLDSTVPVISQRDYDYDVNLNYKKRGSTGLLNLNRRKTTEVRLGPESVPNSRKQSTNVLLEEEFKRPRSPIECIKSLFRGGNQKLTGKDNLNSSSNYSSSRYSSGNNNNNSNQYGSNYSGYNNTSGGTNNYKRYGGNTESGGRSETNGNSTIGRFGPSSVYNGGNRTNAPNRWGYEDTHL